MAVDGKDDPNKPKDEPEHPDPTKLQGSLLWWWVWIPIIIIVTLWLGGWGFGNYGGPWSGHSRSGQPKISDPVVGAIQSGGNAAFV